MRVFGLDPRLEGVKVHERVGYLPGELSLYERMTAQESSGRSPACGGAGRDWSFVTEL